MGALGSPAAGRTLTVLLAIHGFPMLVAGYRAVVGGQPDMAVVGVLERREALLEHIASATADVVVTECQPYGGDGCASFETVEAIRAANPVIRILAIECRCASEQFSVAIKAGANGFLTREAHPADVLDALRRVGRGETYLSPTVVTKMVNTYVLRNPEVAGEDAYESLSERGREILRLAAHGRTNREIARTLHISEQSVHNHRATIMEKLGVHDRIDLLKYALRRGVIQAAEL